MHDPVPSDPIEHIQALNAVAQIVEPVTCRFPISQIVAPLADTFGWLLDDVSTEEQWKSQQESFQARFAERWRVVSDRTLNPHPRATSDVALSDPTYDPLHGEVAWGVELTRAFRAVFAELDPVTGEASSVLPTSDRIRAFARAMHVQDSDFVLPVISYAPLLQSEWEAILERLNEIVELALSFEGALVVWLIGGFFRDVNGRLTLHPQLSLAPPSPGTRVKPIHVLIGTDYIEQCPSIAPLACGIPRPRAAAALVEETPWQRAVIQLDIAETEYELLSLNRLSDNEREISRQVMYIEQRPRAAPVLRGQVDEVMRPWRRDRQDLESGPNLPRPQTQILPPRSALQEAIQPTDSPSASPLSTVEELAQDAEQLRRKGLELAESDPIIAQKYLLASTVLENTSVDVWLKLVDLASNERQRTTFQREAEKVLRRQRKGD